MDIKLLRTIASEIVETIDSFDKRLNHSNVHREIYLEQLIKELRKIIK